ncbi:MAG: hypothetical protein V3U60_16260 [Gammaproteobacteria bacterium]
MALEINTNVVQIALGNVFTLLLEEDYPAVGNVLKDVRYKNGTLVGTYTRQAEIGSDTRDDYSDWLIQTCTIQEYTVTGQDDLGNPIEAWTDKAVSERCRLEVLAGLQGAKLAENNMKALVTQFVVFFTGTSTVLQDDRLTLIGGTAAKYSVDSVRPVYDGTALHHLEAYVTLTD